MTWEKGRQLKSFDSNTYTYNANGIRTSKTINGITHKYILDGTKILSETWDDNTLVPMYDNEDSVCGIVYRNIPYYFLKNQQGDVISISCYVNGVFQVVARYSYDAWGVCDIVSDTSGRDIANINPFRYRGYYYDREIGLYYLQSRYYDANVGRFINGDDCEVILIENVILGKNIFCYCCNCSINNYDYDGRLAISGAVVAAVLTTLLKYLAVAAVAYCVGVLIQNVVKLLHNGKSSQTQTNVFYRAILNVFCSKVKTLKDKMYTSIQKLYQAIVNLLESVAQSYLKARQKYKNNMYHLHHIVAQKSIKAVLARTVLYSVKWDTNNIYNTIWISQVLHSSLHTNLYYSSVNSIFLTAYGKPRSERVSYIIAIYLVIHIILRSFDATL